MKHTAALARSRVYRYLSLAFADPSRALSRELREGAALLEASLAGMGDAVCLAKARALRSLLGRLTPKALQAAHTKCFGYAISKECPPYEAEYGQANLFQKTQTLADIAGFYRAFGLDTAPQLHERADHLSVELEFMQFLCLKEAHAALRGEAAERAAQCRAAQAKFLERHLGAWARGFARRLGAAAGEGPYAALAGLLGAFLAAEAKRLGARLSEDSPLNEAPACGRREETHECV